MGMPTTIKSTKGSFVAVALKIYRISEEYSIFDSISVVFFSQLVA